VDIGGGLLEKGKIKNRRQVSKPQCLSLETDKNVAVGRDCQKTNISLSRGKTRGKKKAPLSRGRPRVEKKKNKKMKKHNIKGPYHCETSPKKGARPEWRNMATNGLGLGR